MKRFISYVIASLVLVLTLSGPVFAIGIGGFPCKPPGKPTKGVPEPGTAALLGALAASGIVIRKITRR